MRCNIVVVDANFLFLPIQFKIDFLSEINYLLEGKNYFLIYKQIFDELESKKKITRNLKIWKRIKLC